MFSTQSYRDLIADLSQSLPRWSPDESDVKLDATDLAIVMAEHGNAGQFVAEALEAIRPDDTDGFDTLAVRAQSPLLDLAVQGCGVTVVAAIQDYAARQVIRDVEAWRDAEPVRGPRESDETYYGVRGLFGTVTQ